MKYYYYSLLLILRKLIAEWVRAVLMKQRMHLLTVHAFIGCHALALDLVCKWQFTSAKLQLLALANHATPSAGALNRDATSLNMVRPGQHHRRRSSLFQPKRRRYVAEACMLCRVKLSSLGFYHSKYNHHGSSQYAALAERLACTRRFTWTAGAGCSPSRGSEESYEGGQSATSRI